MRPHFSLEERERWLSHTLDNIREELNKIIVTVQDNVELNVRLFLNSFLHMSVPFTEGNMNYGYNIDVKQLHDQETFSVIVFSRRVPELPEP